MAALVWLPAVHKCELRFAAWFNPEPSAWVQAEPQELQGRKTPPHTTSRLPKCSQIPLCFWMTQLTALSLTATFAKGRACTQLTRKALSCCHLGTGAEAISDSHLVIIISEVFQNSFPKYLVACSQVTFFWSVWESSEWGPCVVPLAAIGTFGRSSALVQHCHLEQNSGIVLRLPWIPLLLSSNTLKFWSIFGWSKWKWSPEIQEQNWHHIGLNYSLFSSKQSLRVK